MKKIIIKGLVVITFSIAMFGCSHKHSYEGNGEYSELSHRNIVYRDLTKPISVDNPEVKQDIQTMPNIEPTDNL